MTSQSRDASNGSAVIRDPHVSAVLTVIKARHAAEAKAKADDLSSLTKPDVTENSSSASKSTLETHQPASPNAETSVLTGEMIYANGTQQVSCALERGVTDRNPLYKPEGKEDYIKSYAHLRSRNGCNDSISSSLTGADAASAASESAKSSDGTALVASGDQVTAEEGAAARRDVTKELAASRQVIVEEMAAAQHLISKDVAASRLPFKTDHTAASRHPSKADGAVPTAEDQADISDESESSAHEKVSRKKAAAPEADSISHIYVQVFKNAQKKGVSPWVAKMLIKTAPLEELDYDGGVEVFANMRRAYTLSDSVRRAAQAGTISTKFRDDVKSSISALDDETDFVGLLTRERREAYNSEYQLAVLDVSDLTEPVLLLRLGERHITIKLKEPKKRSIHGAVFIGYYDPLDHFKWRRDQKTPAVKPVSLSTMSCDAETKALITYMAAEINKLRAEVDVLKRDSYYLDERVGGVRHDVSMIRQAMASKS